MQTCLESSPVEQTPSNEETGCEPQANVWERMELRLSQPPPEPSLFNGDPAKHLRFTENINKQDHHSLLHISTKNEIEDVKGNPEQSSPVGSNL